MVPISAFCYAHHRGLSLTILNGVYRRTGVYGFLALPFFTLAMEKSGAGNVGGVGVCLSKE